MVLREMPAVRRQRPARDGRLRHLPRLSMVPPPLPVDRVQRPPLRSGADEAVASGGELHRWERARRSASTLCPLYLHGLLRPRAAACASALSETPRGRLAVLSAAGSVV